jgi:hypothetical protein
MDEEAEFRRIVFNLDYHEIGRYDSVFLFILFNDAVFRTVYRLMVVV